MGNFLKSALLLISVVFVTVAGDALALDYEITKVVEVGPAYGRSLLSPAKWSPDGSRLVLFHKGKLLISDTLGKVEEICNIDWMPRRFEWVDNQSLWISQRHKSTSDSTAWRLIKVNITARKYEVLRENSYGIFDDDRDMGFEGPYLTIEGNCYIQTLERGKLGEILFDSSLIDKYGMDNLTDNHIFRPGEDALYLVKASLTDSVKISNKPYFGYQRILPIILSSDAKYAMFGGNIVRLSDDEIIAIDTFPQVLDRPEGTVSCGIGSIAFNPVYPEAGFRIGCSNGLDYGVKRIGLYDYNSNELTSLDMQIDLSNCDRPNFSPDGKNIAIVSGGSLYIIFREVK